MQEELLAELLADDGGAHKGHKGQGSSKKGKKKKAKQAKGKQAAKDAAAQGSSAPASQQEQSAEQQQTQEAMPSSGARQQSAELVGAPEPAGCAPATTEDQADGGQRAPSPDWQVVGRAQRHQAPHHLRQHSDGGSSGGHMRRCPSASSLGSTCR